MYISEKYKKSRLKVGYFLLFLFLFLFKRSKLIAHLNKLFCKGTSVKHILNSSFTSSIHLLNVYIINVLETCRSKKIHVPHEMSHQIEV